MSTRGGIFWKLKDTSLPWSDRVKIARYTWKFDHVRIPNKEQVVLDWLCLSLTGKKRVGEEDAACVWQCFHDVLNTRKCHLVTPHGQPLRLKGPFVTLLLDKLSKAVEKVDVNVKLDLLISCATAIVSSPTISPVLCGIYEYMLKLTVLAVKLCHQYSITEDEGIRDKARNLLSSTLHKYAITQRQKAINAQHACQKVSNKLLPPAISLLGRQGNNSGEFRETIILLQKVLVDTLFTRELELHYELYLKVKLGISDGKIANSIKSVFTALTAPREITEEVSSLAMCLPIFYEAFINRFKLKSDNPTVFHMVMHLCDTVGIDITNGCCKHEDIAVKSMSGLLQVVVKYDVYSISYDYSNGKQQLLWLQKLVAVLLKTKHRSEDWYLCVISLMSLSHHTIENKLTPILSAALLSSSENVETEKAKGEFLVKLITTYERLHQIRKLFGKILEALKCSEEGKPCEWPRSFLKKLSRTLTILPHGSCLAIWRLLLQNIHDTQSTGFNDTCGLLSTFLQNVHFADHTIPELTVSQVCTLMEQTADLLVGYVKDGSSSNNDSLTAVLECLWSWGELHILLSHCNSHYSNKIPVSPLQSAFSCEDMSLVYPQLSKTKWAKLAKSLKEKGKKEHIYLLELFCVQKVRAVLLFGGGKTNSEVTSIQNVVTYICDLTPDPEGRTNNASWNGQIKSIMEANWHVAHWDMICRYFSLVAPFCSDGHLLNTASYLLHCLAAGDISSHESELTTASVSKNFVQRPDFSELSSLNSAVITSVIYNMSKMFHSGKKSNKKAKSAQAVVSDLLSPLCDTDVKWHQPNVKKLDASPDTWRQLKTVSETLQKLMDPFTKIPVKRYSQQTESTILKYFKVLSFCPLEHLPVTDKARLFLTLLTVMSTNCSLDPDLEPEAVLNMTSESELRLVEKCMTFLLLLQDGASEFDVFSVMDASCTLSWTMGFYSMQLFKKAKHVEKKYRQLMKRLLRLTIYNASHMADLQKYVEKINESFGFLTSQYTTDTPMVFKYGTLLTPVIVLQTLSKVLRFHLKDEMRSLCSVYYQKLSKGFLPVVSHVLKNSEEMQMLMSLIVEGYTAVLNYASKDSTEESLDDVKEFLPKICKQCLKNLQDNQDLKSTFAAIQFVWLVCSRKDKLEVHCSKKFFYKVWNSLLDLKKQVTPTESKDQILHINSEDDEMESLNIYEHRDLQSEIDEVLASVLSVSSSENFATLMQNLLQDVSVENVNMVNHRKIRSSLDLWNHLVSTQLGEEKRSVLHHNSQNLVLQIQHVAEACHRNIKEEFSAQLMVHLLNTQSTMLKSSPSLLTSQSAITCLHSCFSCSLEGASSLPIFVDLFQGLYYVLHEMLVHHEAAVMNSVPAFLSAAKRLMFGVITEGNQEKFNRNEAELQQLVSCAQLVERLFTLLASHKTELSRVAPYVVADYVNAVQKVTLWPKLKKSLLPSVYRFLDICDTYSVSLLQTVLGPGVREVFRTLYDEFNKYHKYRGKV